MTKKQRLKNMKPFWIRNWKDGAMYFSAPNQLAANLTAPMLHYPISRGLGLLYRGTVGQRLFKAEDPYGVCNENGNGADRKEKKPDYRNQNLQPNY